MLRGKSHSTQYRWSCQGVSSNRAMLGYYPKNIWWACEKGRGLLALALATDNGDKRELSLKSSSQRLENIDENGPVRWLPLSCPPPETPTESMESLRYGTLERSGKDAYSSFRWPL
ncbi:hypothetical protein CRYUN_Cryun33cG0091200 [Craigia yunnanensis]